MSGHYPARSAIWAAAAIIVRALGACSSTTSTSASAVASIGPTGRKPTLASAGSTFDAPFFARHQQPHRGVTIGCSAVGTGAGIAAFSAPRVDFGASDVPMTASEQAAAKGGPATQVPVALGGEGVAYNLNLPAGARLHLTGPVLAAIYLGQVTHWNDPALTALNPGQSLPEAAINGVHRSDGNGTTYIFSNYVSSIDPARAAKVGSRNTLRWPAGQAEGNGGVATAVDRTPFFIGYIEQAYSQGLTLPLAAIRNQAGNTSPRPPRPSRPSPPINLLAPRPTFPSSTSPDPAATRSAATAGRSSAPASPARPPARPWSPLLDWLTGDGQACAAANGYVPLPSQVEQLARTLLQQITGSTGPHLLSWP